MGFAEQDHATDGMEAIRRMFSPEFRNRLDGIIQFNSLPEEVILSVVDKFLVELQARLDERKVYITVSDEARAWLATRGYDQAMGARPMSRLIQDQIKKRLADALLFGALKQGGEVFVLVENDELHFQIKESKTGKVLEEV
jgi:ATP-dependent Clp protease ATP-binding subunit ClpA